MDIVITEWALQSYLDLYAKRAFTAQEYKQQLRPDVLLLKKSWPRQIRSFTSASSGAPLKFATQRVPDGFKMKWHNMGDGKVQLRLCVTWFRGRVFLCQAYIKDSTATDAREIAKFLGRVQMIHQSRHVERGVL